MRPLDILWLLLAGLGGGLAGTIAGLASLVSYPALLALGLPALSANMTNTVALVFNGVGAVWGSRPELAGRPRSLRRLCVVAIAGGVGGAALLIVTPAHVFQLVVPILIAGGSLGVVLRRHRAAPHGGPARPLLLEGAVFLTSLYSGYFGAAAGVILLAVLLLVSGDGLVRSSAVKNLLLGLANGVAAVTFALVGPVRWIDVPALAAGFLVGGRVGPEIIRRVPADPLRLAIAAGGLFLAVHLALAAYR